MVHKSVWTGWSDAAPVRPSHAENESDHFYRAQVWKLSPSPIASEPIRADAHARHSISAGPELIKLSISDNLCLRAAPHPGCLLAPVVQASLSFFVLHFSVWRGSTDVDTLVHIQESGVNYKGNSQSSRNLKLKHGADLL